MEAKIALLEKEISSNKSLLRQKDEEIDRLTYHNEMLTKRVTSGQRELKKSSSIWSLKSYISSAPTIEASRPEQDLVQKELQSKIDENGLT
jgi:hypothetical protein